MDYKQLDRKVAAEVWTSGELYSNLEYLTSLGGRYAFSPEAHEAARYIERSFQKSLGNAELDSFEMTGWRSNGASLHCNGGKEFYCRPLLNSAATPPDGVTGKLLEIGPGFREDIEQLSPEMKGKLVIVNQRRITKADKMHRMEIAAAAETAGAAAFLFAQAPSGLLPPAGSAADGRLSRIPAVALSAEEAWKLLQYSRASEEPGFKLVVDTESFPGEGVNVIGRAGPETPDDGAVLLCAHYDGHEPGDAAQDNAAGVAIIMELARLFGALDLSQARRSIYFAAFSGEESGLIGSSSFAAGSPDLLSMLRVVYNFDCPAMGGRPLLGVIASGRADDFFIGIGNDTGYPFPIRHMRTRFSDHYPFLSRGIPAIWQLSSGPARTTGRGWGHTAADTLDKIDERELREASMMAGMIVLRLLYAPAIPFEVPPDGGVR